ncbi:Sugar phosphate permease [Sporomusa malonica]|uniref:Sugar phosphate permease n=2 Tax=Sporomusa malonica TaxID=112901 RepID=A0A1W2D761_9FIRM|nr:Sugar phosphate permease [Sporomusa malonica]
MSGKMTQYRWWVMAFIFVIYTIANADRANIGFALPYIRKEFAMSNTEAGAIISLFFAGYSIGQIPSGFLIRKFGMRSMFSMGMLLTSIFTGLLGFAGNAFHFKALRLLIGLAESPVVVGCTTTINQWFPPKEKGTATGMFLAGSKLGPLIVPPICAWIILTFGWREIFIAFMIPGVLLSVFWYIMVNNKPEESRFVSQKEVEYIHSSENVAMEKKNTEKKSEYKLWWLDKIVRAKKVEPLVNSKQIFRSWDIYGAAMGYFFMVGIVSVLMSWLPSYLVNVKQFAIMKTAFVSASPFAGTVVGNFLGGWVSDRFLNKRRKPLMMVTALSTTIMMYSLVYAPADAYLLALLLFGTGFLLSVGYSAFAVYPMGRTTKEAYPVAWGIVNTGGQLGGTCFPLIVGMILDKFNWDVVFASLAFGSFICLLIVSTIIEPVEDPLEKPHS